MKDREDDLLRLLNEDPETFRRLMQQESQETEEMLRESELRSRQHNERMWRKLAGEHFEEMLASRESAEKYLSHPDWQLRVAAIAILRSVWEPDKSLAAACEEMLLKDPHSQVRGIAAITLGSIFQGTNDRRVGSLLATVVKGTTLPDSVRRSAHQALFHIRGVFVLDIPLPGTYRFPEDVDWDFVNSLWTRTRRESVGG